MPRLRLIKTDPQFRLHFGLSPMHTSEHIWGPPPPTDIQQVADRVANLLGRYVSDALVRGGAGAGRRADSASLLGAGLLAILMSLPDCHGKP